MDSKMEQKYIAKAMVHSFRDLRGGDNGIEDDDGDNMSIPTFARPPRIIKNSNPTTNTSTYHHTNAKHTHSPHLATVQETSSVKDLLDDNNYATGHDTGHDSDNDGPYNFIRSTSSITIDTMLRDSHLDNDNI